MSSLLNEETLNFDDYQFTVLDLSPEVVTSKWLGYSGASDEQLERAELRLGIQLPPSCREFLQITNGWRQPYHDPNSPDQIHLIDYKSSRTPLNRNS